METLLVEHGMKNLLEIYAFPAASTNTDGAAVRGDVDKDADWKALDADIAGSLVNARCHSLAQ